MSSDIDQLSTYQTSSWNLSSQPRRCRPFTCANPVNPGSTSCVAPARGVQSHVLHEERSRTHKAHVSPQNIDQLWQFINTRFSEEVPQLRYPLIHGYWMPSRITPFSQRTKLDELKRASPVAGSNLAKEYRPPHGQSDGNSDDCHQRCQECEGNASDRDIGHPLGCNTHAASVGMVGLTYVCLKHFETSRHSHALHHCSLSELSLAIYDQGARERSNRLREGSRDLLAQFGRLA